jgi:DNA-binding transcriptional ArsR family regulator
MKTTLRQNLKVFDENKLMILKVLYECADSDICGCDLIGRLDLSKNLISYHIKTLIQLGYILETRCSRKKIYKINELYKQKIRKILEVTELIKEMKIYEK